MLFLIGWVKTNSLPMLTLHKATELIINGFCHPQHFFHCFQQLSKTDHESAILFQHLLFSNRFCIAISAGLPNSLATTLSIHKEQCCFFRKEQLWQEFSFMIYEWLFISIGCMCNYVVKTIVSLMALWNLSNHITSYRHLKSKITRY